MTTLRTKCRNLSSEDLENGFDFISNQLIAIGKFSDKNEAKVFAINVMEKFSNESYRMRFSRLMMEIEAPGIALSESFRKQVLKEMVCRWSILNHFSGLNYERSSLKQAVHNAFKIFNSSPMNTKTTITA